MSRPESTASSIDISDIENIFPSPPRLSVSVRKTLPPLPSVLEAPSPKTRSFSEPNVLLSSSPRPGSRPGSAAKLMLQSQGEPIREFTRPLEFPLNFIPPPPPTPQSPVAKAASTRPLTSSTKTLSFASAASKRTIKYGTGKFAGVELSPQPSDDPMDPLNWPVWRKHLNFLALLLMVALVGVMKTAFITVHGAIAESYNVSYTAAVGLTAAPLMISGLGGTLSLVTARIWGKRPVYLASATFVFIGVVLNTNVLGSFAQHMVGRALQGLGWGAFETLVLSSIQDTYFEHERQRIIVGYNVVAVATTWGSPLIGGVVASTPAGFTKEFKVIVGFISVAILLLVFGAPETVFDRSSYYPPMPATMARSRSRWPNVRFTKEAVRGYLGKMKPYSYGSSGIDARLIMQAPRAMVAPTTLLLFVTTVLPYAGLWSLTSSLSLLFSPMPFMLPESTLGVLMTGPFLLTTAICAAVALATPYLLRRFTTTVHIATLATGTAIASIGVFGFGLYIGGTMQAADGSPWDTGAGSAGERVSLPVVSLLLGLLGAGSLLLDATARPVISRSTAFTSSSLPVGLRGTADMHGGLSGLRNLAAGALALALPHAAWGRGAAWDGLRSAALGLGAAQLLVAAAACAAFWFLDERIRRLDGRAMGLVDLASLGSKQRQGSFFDTD